VSLSVDGVQRNAAMAAKLMLPFPLLADEAAAAAAGWGVYDESRQIARTAIFVVGRDLSIPFRYVGQRLDVRIGATLVRFYAGSELAKTHLRGQPGQRQTDWDDYPPHKAAFFQRTPAWCRAQAAHLGAHVLTAVTELLEQHHLHYLRQSQGIIRLAETYGATRLDAACERALAYGHPHLPHDQDDPGEGPGAPAGCSRAALHRDRRRLPARA
jgi:hypothetical protein